MLTREKMLLNCLKKQLKSRTILSRFYSQQTEQVNLAYDLYDKYNSNKSLVIAHGLFASKFSWRSLSKALNERLKIKIYTIDMRNHGDSLPYTSQMTYTCMANDLKLFIDNVVLKNQNTNEVNVLGHSMGGKTAMTLALEHPDTITKLIVSDVSPNRSPSTGIIKTILDTIVNIDLTQFNDVYIARKEVDKALIQDNLIKNEHAMRAFILTRLIDDNGVLKWHFNLSSILSNLNNIMDFPEFNYHYDKQVLFLAGEKSNYIMTKDEVDIEKYFSNYEIIRVKNAGHVIHFDNPVDTIKYIDQFLNK